MDGASGCRTPPLRDTDSENGADAGDSDFDSSDLDEVMMSMGTERDGFESARIARVWGQRAHNKRKQKQKKPKVDADGDAIMSADTEDEPPEKRPKVEDVCENVASGRSSLPARLSDEWRSMFVQAQIQYAEGKFAEAIESCKELVRLEEGVADPFHLLAVIYKERSDGASEPNEAAKFAKKSVDSMLLAAYLTPMAAGRALWKRVAERSKDLGLIAQACYAYKRSIGGRSAKTTEELQSMESLAQLYFQKGRRNEGIALLHDIYKATGDEYWAKETAKWLVTSKRWRECLVLLGDCVERGRTNRQGLDLNTLNMYCEVLLEVRDFEKCARLLIEVFELSTVNDKGLDTSLTTEQLNEKLVQRPVDLLTKLAVSSCHLQKSQNGPNAICACTVETVLLHSAEHASDLYLSIVDALLANDASLASGLSSEYARAKPKHAWPAKLASRILDLIANCGLELDGELKERKATSLWQLGHAKEAALLWEEVYDIQSSRTEVESRDLGLRIAEAWYECGEPERADKYITSLGWEDLRDTKILPRAMSSEKRRAEYIELNELADRLLLISVSGKELEWEDVQQFATRFRHLVLDCELDKTRLTRRNRASSNVPVEEDTNIEQNCVGETLANERGSALDTRGDVQEARDSSSREIVAVRSLENQPHQIQLLDNVNVAHKFKRRHLALESIDDMFGFEAYISFLLKGLRLLQECKFKDDKGAGLRIRTVEMSRIVDICDIVCINRPLTNAQNPVKRRYLRELVLKSVSLAFEARHWHYVFKHLRGLCRTSVDGAPLALLARVLFTHPELHLPPTRTAKKSVDPAPWDKRQQAVSASGHRTTYAASMVDVRQWALRQLIQKPNSYALQLLAGHFCICASQYSLAVAEYSRAHRLAPSDAMTCLCLGAAYISFAMSRNAFSRHDLILKGYAFLQRYRTLRLQSIGRRDDSDGFSIDQLVIGAEADYNFGRGFHQLGIYNLAVRSYRNALDIIEHASEEQLMTTRHDFVAVRRACAFNLASVYRSQNSFDMARVTLLRHIVF